MTFQIKQYFFVVVLLLENYSLKFETDTRQKLVPKTGENIRFIKRLNALGFGSKT